MDKQVLLEVEAYQVKLISTSTNHGGFAAIHLMISMHLFAPNGLFKLKTIHPLCETLCESIIGMESCLILGVYGLQLE